MSTVENILIEQYFGKESKLTDGFSIKLNLDKVSYSASNGKIRSIIVDVSSFNIEEYVDVFFNTANQMLINSFNISVERIRKGGIVSEIIITFSELLVPEKINNFSIFFSGLRLDAKEYDKQKININVALVFYKGNNFSGLYSNKSSLELRKSPEITYFKITDFISPDEQIPIEWGGEIDKLELEFFCLDYRFTYTVEDKNKVSKIKHSGSIGCINILKKLFWDRLNMQTFSIAILESEKFKDVWKDGKLIIECIPNNNAKYKKSITIMEPNKWYQCIINEGKSQFIDFVACAKHDGAWALAKKQENDLLELWHCNQHAEWKKLNVEIDWTNLKTHLETINSGDDIQDEYKIKEPKDYIYHIPPSAIIKESDNNYSIYFIGGSKIYNLIHSKKIFKLSFVKDDSIGINSVTHKLSEFEIKPKISSHNFESRAGHRLAVLPPNKNSQKNAIWIIAGTSDIINDKGIVLLQDESFEVFESELATLNRFSLTINNKMELLLTGGFSDEKLLQKIINPFINNNGKMEFNNMDIGKVNQIVKLHEKKLALTTNSTLVSIDSDDSTKSGILLIEVNNNYPGSYCREIKLTDSYELQTSQPTDLINSVWVTNPLFKRDSLNIGNLNEQQKYFTLQTAVTEDIVWILPLYSKNQYASISPLFFCKIKN
jgi:hypothetical protein